MAKHGLTEINDENGKLFPVAIVGMSCRFQDIETIDDYRNVLKNKLKCYSEITKNRWDWTEFHHPVHQKRGYHSNNTMGSLEDRLFSFDNLYFNTSPRESLGMDAQQFQVLEAAQEALNDAGIADEKIPKGTAVYMSMKMGEQTLVMAENRYLLNSYVLTGGAHTVAANRINFYYDIEGPSMGVEGGDSAAISSLHFGVWSLWNKECDMVLAGGSNLILSAQYNMCYSNTGNLSSSGVDAPFDANADGCVRSEGTTMMVLKPLDLAIKDGDHVHAVIRATGLVYHDKTFDMCYHTKDSYNNSIESVHKRFGIPSEKIDFVEAHAAGIPEEDEKEVESINETIALKKDSKLLLGSCKGNLGHSESVSGMASVIKAALMISNREIYPTANFNEPSKNINEFEKIAVQKEYEKYDKDKNMMVGVNCTSFAGQQCHMVLEEYRPPTKVINPSDLAGWSFGGDDTEGRSIPITLSAKSKAALKEMAANYKDYANENDAQQVASWISQKLNHHPNRMMVLANSATDFKNKMEAYVNGEHNDDIIEGQVPANLQRKPICFIYPGQGQQWWDMGRSLYATEQIYRDVVHRCDAVYQELGGFSFLEKYKIFVADTEGVSAELIDQILVCQPAIVAHQIGLTEVYRNWGIIPDMVCGHSLGEVASAYASGGMTLEECVRSIYIRSTSQNKLSGTGAMAAARLSPEEGEELCAKHEDIWVACRNSTDNCTLAGGIPIIDKLCAELPKTLKKIRVKAAFHTIHMRPVREEFYSRMQGQYVEKLCPDGYPTMYSSVKSDATKGPFNPDYWWKNLEERVDFVGPIKAIFRDHKDVVFVEIGSSATLMGSIRQTAKKVGASPAALIVAGHRNKCDRLVALRAAAQLYTMGYDLNWKNITRDCAKYIPLPNYPFQRNFYRVESQLYKARRLAELDKSFYGQNGEINVNHHPYLGDYKIQGKALFPASGFFEYLMEGAEGDQPHIKDIRLWNDLTVPQTDAVGRYECLYTKLKKNARQLAVVDKKEKVAATATLTNSVTSPQNIDISAILPACTNNVNVKTMYDNFKKNGLVYGEYMQMLEELKTGDGVAFGKIFPRFTRHEVIDTPTLEAAFQATTAAFVPGNAIYTAKRAASLQLYTKQFPRFTPYYVYSKLLDFTANEFSVDITIMTEDGEPLAAITNCIFVNVTECKFIDQSSLLYKGDQKIEAYEPQLNLTKEDWMLLPLSSKKRFKNIANRRLGKKELKIRVHACATEKDGTMSYGSAGVVESTGAAVKQYNVGDKVLCLTPANSSTVVYTQEHAILPMPKDTSFTDAAFIPSLYGTMQFMLHHVAQLRTGESVFVNDTETPLGKAAINLAKAKGARIACQGNDTDTPANGITFMNVKSGTFQEKARAFTGGVGFDMIIDVIGNITDDIIDCARDNGRICFVSSTNFEKNMRPAGRNVIWCKAEGKPLAMKGLPLYKEAIQAALQLLKEKKIPTITMEAVQPEQLYLLELNNGLIGLDLSDKYIPESMETPDINITPEATYVLINGSEGIGPNIAEWLVSRGAKHLVISSNKRKRTLAQRFFIKSLSRKGIDTHDITSKPETLLSNIKNLNLPAIYGIIHLPSSTESIESYSNYASSLLNQKPEVKFYLMASSIAGLIGDPEHHSSSIEYSTITDVAMKAKRSGVNVIAPLLGAIKGAALYARDDTGLTKTGNTALHIDTYIQAIETLLQAVNTPDNVSIIKQDWTQAGIICGDKKDKFSTLFNLEDITEESLARKKERDVTETLYNYIATILFQRRELLEENQPLYKYGFDRFLTREFNEWLDETYNMTIPETEMRNGITIQNVIDRILGRH